MDKKFSSTGEVTRETKLQDLINYLQELKDLGQEGINVTIDGACSNAEITSVHFGVKYGGLHILIDTQNDE